MISLSQSGSAIIFEVAGSQQAWRVNPVATSSLASLRISYEKVKLARLRSLTRELHLEQVVELGGLDVLHEGLDDGHVDALVHQRTSAGSSRRRYSTRPTSK